MNENDHYNKVLKRFDNLKASYLAQVKQVKEMKAKRAKQEKPLVEKVRKLEKKIEGLENLLATRSRLDKQLPDEEKLFIQEMMNKYEQEQTPS